MAQRIGPTDEWQALQAGLRALPHPGFVIDRHGRYRLANDAFFHLFAVTAESVIGRTAAEWASVAEIAGHQHGDDEVLAGRGPVVYEMTTTLDASARELLVHKAALIGADGRPDGIIGSLVDLTSVTAERRLLERMLDAIPDAIGLQDLDHRVLRYNAAGYRLVRIDARQLDGRRCWELTGESSPCQACATSEVYRTRSAARCEKHWPERGLWFDVRSYPVLDEQGELAAVIEHLRDVTREKQVELELRESERRYRELFEHAPVGIYRTTPDGQIVAANPALIAMLGFASFAELVERDLEAEGFADPSARDTFKRQLAAADVVTGLETSWLRHDGRRIVVREHARVVRNDAGEVLFFEGFVEDISERCRLEEQLRQAQRMEAIGRLAAGVAHDFNNLLTVICGNLEMLKSDLAGQDEEVELIDEALTATSRGVSLAQQLLLFSRKKRSAPAPLDLVAAVAEMAKLLGRLLGEQVQLVLPGARPPLWIWADRGMIEQVLINLTANARDAMRQGGRVVIDLDREVVDVARASAEPRRRPGTFVRLSVTDTGVGITPENLAHIFEPFFTTKEVGHGCGLGLATVLGIVEQHGGWVELTSEVGAGTRVQVYLPETEARPGAPPPADATPRVAGEGERILLVEDEAVVQDLVARILGRAGYRVTRAPSGAAALALDDETLRQIDLLVSDVVMPGGVNGYQLAASLRQRLPDLPVVLISGYAPDSERDAAPSLPDIVLVPKPFTSDELLGVIADHLRARRRPGG